MAFKQRLWLGWKKDKKGDTEFYPINKINTNPFKNYKTALKVLQAYISSKTVLSNYEPNDIEWALFTLFKSKKFMNKL